MSGPAEYKGVPSAELRIDAVIWTEDATEHIRTRRDRKGSETETDIEPEWATEAALDLNRVVLISAGMSQENQSLVVIGWSDSFGGLLRVWIWTDHPTGDVWNGASACKARPSDERRYEDAAPKE